MKLSDHKHVTKLIDCRNRIIAAIVQLTDSQEDEDFTRVNPGMEDDPVFGLGNGFWCALAKHGDGSGSYADLTGCYVATQMVEATFKVLEVKLKEVEQELTNRGVKI